MGWIVLFVLLLQCKLGYSVDPADRAKALLAKMTLDEKLTMVQGQNGPYVGNVPPNTRLGIPALTLNDGPQGFRGIPGTSTAFPCALAVAATFDRQRAFEFGATMGKEFLDKGSNVQLGPGLCIARVPLNGRNFEYLSGEDPYLGAALVGPVVKGIQGRGVIANAKHWVLNNQETNRDTVSDNADERTRFELYYPPFQAAIDAGVGSFMCSYNKIDSTYSCENNQTLGIDLKERMGFKGWVMSDWGATHSTVPSALAGLDQEMPTGQYYHNLHDAVVSGQVPMSVVDDKVLRILTPMFAMGLFDRPASGNISANVTSPQHAQTAQEIAADSAVLLKNDGVLPFDASKGTYAIIGNYFPVAGGGSGHVDGPHVITPCTGIAMRVSNGQPRPTNCTFDEGYDYFQPGNPSAPSTSKEDCCAQCTARFECNYFTYVAATQTCWFKSTNDGRRPAPGLVSGSAAPLSGRVKCVGSDVQDAVAAAKAADVAIVVVGTDSSEGSDRTSLSLGNGQDQLISAVAAAQPNTIVVASTPGALLTPWSSQVRALLLTFMPGQEAGHAVADVLFGDVNPSGRLPITMPNKENETGFTPQQYPGVNLQADYSEKLLVGYRWYDQNKVQPKFPFGFGLSYTSFQYSAIQIVGSTVKFTLTNTGAVKGADVPQLYLAYPPEAGEPPKVLRDFQKVLLKPSQSTVVTFTTLTDRDFSIWDATRHAWSPVSGAFQVLVGPSSGDIRLTGTISR